MRIAGLVLVLSLVAGSGPLYAEERRQLGAHEHGHSTLNIAIEGERVMMELMAPGMDIVGFEHAAASEEDKAAIERAEASLADPLTLFVFPAGARCTVETAAVALAGGDHDEHADEAEHDEEASGESERHTEFHAEYIIGCGNPEAIETIRFAFFEQFEAAEEVEVNFVTEHGQTSYEVDRDDPSIDLGGVM